MRRLPAVILIIVGLGLIAYPTVRRCYYDYRQRQLLNAWAGVVTPVEGPKEPPGPRAQEGPDPALLEYIRENMIGILSIPRINLELPVLRRDSAADLDISAAHVAGSAGPGEAGNFIVSGHRQLEYGRHFNRLHEVGKGDLIEFAGVEKTFTYQVFDARIIQSEETGVLEPSEEKLITLITCHGWRKPFSRYVVRGRLLE